MKGLLVCAVFLLQAGVASAQCAMCSTQLENNISAGNPGIATGINVGILYLLAMPYLAVIIIGYLWYRSSKQSPTS
ncbi:MAG TPA: hypothetical protein VFW11_03090 [Cyclobacteriaceae bacterium]|nr:hypothetical protein [Cyclobacteriaceae bacterium]